MMCQGQAVWRSTLRADRPIPKWLRAEAVGPGTQPAAQVPGESQVEVPADGEGRAGCGGMAGGRKAWLLITVIFMACLPCARDCAECFCSSTFHSLSPHEQVTCFSPYFIGKDTEPQRVHTASEWQSLASDPGPHCNYPPGLHHSFHSFMLICHLPGCWLCPGLLGHRAEEDTGIAPQRAQS